MDDARTLWCGNISEKVTEELLYELFLQAAPLERVKIPTDKEGRKSNYAFITVKHECSVPYVTMLLDGTSLFDKRIYVKRRYSAHGQNPNVGNVNLTRRNLNTNQNRSREHNSRDDSRDNREEVGHSNRHRNESPHNEYGSNRHHNYSSNRHNYNNRQGRNYHGKNYHDKNHSRYRY